MVALSRNRQLELPRYGKNGQRRVGPHPGAGRKPKGLRAGVTHAKRAELDPTKPLHITLRVVAAVAALRTAKAYRAIRRALQVSAFNQLGLRIVHVSVQRTHIHLICEADDKQSLARGMQSFKISAAKQLNRALHRRGRVFADRYHVEILRTPTQASHAISYVLNNWRKHGEQHRTRGLYRGRIDPDARRRLRARRTDQCVRHTKPTRDSPIMSSTRAADAARCESRRRSSRRAPARAIAAPRLRRCDRHLR